MSNLEEEVNIGRNLFDEKLMEEKGIAREATAKLAKEVIPPRLQPVMPLDVGLTFSL